MGETPLTNAVISKAAQEGLSLYEAGLTVLCGTLERRVAALEAGLKKSADSLTYIALTMPVGSRRRGEVDADAKEAETLLGAK